MNSKKELLLTIAGFVRPLMMFTFVYLIFTRYGFLLSSAFAFMFLLLEGHAGFMKSLSIMVGLIVHELDLRRKNSEDNQIS